MYEELKVELTSTKQQQILDRIDSTTFTKSGEGYFLKSLLITPVWFTEAQRKNPPNSYKATVIYGRRV